MNAIVFDFDKTLGYFEQLHKIYILTKKKISISALLLLFPNVFRTYTFQLLQYLKVNKGICSIILYTNNNGPRYFINAVVAFLNDKFDCKIFNNIIYGFKTSDGKTELCRHNSKKRFDDLLSCTGKQFTNILFLDDCLHANMIDERVEYLQIDPYFYNCFKKLNRLENFLNKDELDYLQYDLRYDIIPNSCDNLENIQIVKAVVFFISKLQ